MVNKLLMNFRFSLLQRQLHTVHGPRLRAHPRSPAVPCSHEQPVRSHSATILPSANHECERIATGHERRPSAIAWYTGTTMSSLVDTFADEIMKTRMRRPPIRQCRQCVNVLALDLFVAALSQRL